MHNIIYKVNYLNIILKIYYMELENKKILKIKLESNIYNYFLNSKKYYGMCSLKQFLNYFLPSTFEYIILNNNSEKSDISIWDIQLDDNTLLRNNEINMLISVENLGYWGHYAHYNKYNNYNNDKMNIYLYNHITKINTGDSNNFISIPMIYNYINYYNKNYKIIEPSEYISFKDKKFCLMINKSNLNSEIKYYVNILSQYGEIDNINLYNNYIENKSCYHSIELLNVMNKYKFILCFENSYEDGYITEKIFNCFYSRSIPIYKGSPIIGNYINTDAFINLYNIDNNILERINLINNNEEIFNNIINLNKISSTYTDEDYENKLSIFIENKFSK